MKRKCIVRGNTKCCPDEMLSTRLGRLYAVIFRKEISELQTRREVSGQSGDWPYQGDVGRFSPTIIFNTNQSVIISLAKGSLRGRIKHAQNDS